MKTLTMPSFGADMAKGTLAKWNVKVGEAVNKGDIIASIETMKGLIDMEVFDNGVIQSLLAAEGEELSIGDPIAELRLTSEDDTSNIDIKEPSDIDVKSVNTVIDASQKTDSLLPEHEAHKNQERTKTDTPQIQKSHITRTDQRLAISPAARKRALELGVDWHQLSHGQGPAGALILKDINHAYKMNASSSLPPQNDKATPKEMMRQAVAASVSRSKQEIPHYYLQLDVVLNSAIDWLSAHNANLPPSKRILINAVVYCAIARSLQDFGSFNGFYQNNEYKPSDTVNLGNAISLRTGGIIIASIPNAQNLGLVALMDCLRDQVTRAKKSELRMSEVQNATVTISNLGDRGTDSIQSIIFPPQVAIFGIGRPRKMPWIIDDAISCATIVSISLAADHRVSDGHSGARLLNHMNKLIQNPEKLL
ncbi:MAG: pyruvate dehydrogenase E2 component (dihydrolipoamide acetyltransferase) [Alphaproteobacteria bacterium]|jgi:pyruvate dehydrogenase E2 component (dihydrolipoamide acetyltransferase)